MVKKQKRKAKTERKSFLSMPQWALPWVVLGILILVAGVILLPTKIVKSSVQVPYIDIEEYSVEVPYEAIEEYVESVPYEVTEQYVESIPYTEDVVQRDCNENTGCVCTGTHWFWGYCESCTCTNYKDVIKEKTVTKYRDETKYKTITKTRTEIREREIERERTEETQREVNWLFGFEPIIKFKE